MSLPTRVSYRRRVVAVEIEDRASFERLLQLELPVLFTPNWNYRVQCSAARNVSLGTASVLLTLLCSEGRTLGV